VLKLNKIAWSGEWSKDFPTKKPLFPHNQIKNLKIDKEEFNSYNWISYINLK